MKEAKQGEHRTEAPAKGYCLECGNWANFGWGHVWGHPCAGLDNPAENQGRCESELIRLVTDDEVWAELKEELAALAHVQWSGWMVYLFSKSKLNDDGTLTIPKWAVERWTYQLKTLYENLPEKMKVSDREEADRMIRVFLEHAPPDWPMESMI